MTHIDVNYSIFHKTFKYTLDGVEHDLSNFVPANVWGIANNQFPIHPILDWEIRIKLKKIFLTHFYDNDLDDLVNPDNILFLN